MINFYYHFLKLFYMYFEIQVLICETALFLNGERRKKTKMSTSSSTNTHTSLYCLVRTFIDIMYYPVPNANPTNSLTITLTLTLT